MNTKHQGGIASPIRYSIIFRGVSRLILVTEWMNEQGIELLDHLPRPVLYDPELWADRDGLTHTAQDAEALVVRNNTRVDAALLDLCPNLRVVGRLGVGLDNIDVDACQARRVNVVYARGANAIAVVEYVMGALLYAARPWQTWAEDTKSGTWRRNMGGREVYGKTLGLVGLGDIGSRVARAARLMGMAVRAYDPHLAPFHALIADGTVTPMASVAELLAVSHTVTLHAPLRPDTYHMLNSETLAHFPDDAILINTARGGLIDENALRDRLEQGAKGSIFLDVREKEPPELPDRLAVYPNVYLTPHLAGLTEEALARTTTLVLEDVARVLTGRPPRSPVRWR